MVARESGQMAQDGDRESLHVIEVVDARVECAQKQRRAEQRAHADDYRHHREDEVVTLGSGRAVFLDHTDGHVYIDRMPDLTTLGYTVVL